MSDDSVNFYKSLDDFLDDMDERRKDKNKFVAIEFIYKGETYRINNEYLTPTFAYRVPGVKFWVFLVHFKWVDGWCDPDYDTIGQYSSMDELLEKCKIDGVLLREIIVDPNTEIVTQDNEIDVDDLANL